MSDITPSDLIETNLGDKTFKEDNKATEPVCMKDMPVPDPVKESLTATEYKAAKKDLVKSIAHYKRSRKERNDPPITGQVFCVHSFTPSATAVPDKDGCYGVMKCRGNFANLRDADEKCEFLIRNIDSVSENLISHVGREFPVTLRSDFVEETKEIDVNKKVAEINEEHVRKQKDKEQKEIEDIQNRERTLLEESKHDKQMDSKTVDYYTTQRVKLANLKMARDNAIAKSKEYIASADKTEAEIAELDEAHPSFKEQYMKVYFDSLNRAGIDTNKNPLIQYMSEGIDMSKFVREVKEETKEESKEESKDGSKEEPEKKGDGLGLMSR